MATKAYFIGLGGSGLKTVSALQKKLCPNGPDKQNRDQDTYEFTYIDTDDATLAELNKGGVLISSDDLIPLGSTNPHQIYRNHKGGETPKAKRLNEWVIPQNENKRFVLPNQNLYDGAGAQRMVGRFGIFNCYTQIERELKAKIEKFYAYAAGKNEASKEDIWVVASSCGGTGSSITLDVLYLINKIVQEKAQHAPNLKLVLFMPKVYIDGHKGDENYPLNAFSYMWEMNAFKLASEEGKGNIFKYFSACPIVEKETPPDFKLFQYIIPIDVETNLGVSIEEKNLYPTVAEMLYYLNVGATRNSMISSMSNDKNELTGFVFNEVRSEFRWDKHLVGYGCKVFRKPNDELKQYVRIRGVYEVLKYGLIGESRLQDDSECERVKKEFGQQYVLCHLCDIPSERVNASNESLQSKLNALYDEVRIPQDDITANECKGCLSRLEGKKDDLKNIEKEALNAVKKQIDEGVKKSIIDFGLKYTIDLIYYVDDFYLEKDVKTQLLSLYNDARADVEKQKQNYNKLMQSISDSEKTLKDKVASPIRKVLKDYQEALCKEQLYRISLNIIDSLTKSTIGYLEILRKKGSKSQGLKVVLDKIENAYCKTYADKYQALAEEFRDSSKSVFTVTLPDLDAIATGNNSDWAPDNLFDQLYCSSIIDYDHDKKAESGLKVPLRKGKSGTNFLATYIEPLVEPLFKIALQEDSFTFDLNLKTQILDKIETQIKDSSNQHESDVQKWLDLNLSQTISSLSVFPGGKSRQQFMNDSKNKKGIPVLFPIATGIPESHPANILFVGADENLATEFGYNKDDKERNQFIKDVTIADRFLMIKMPLGLNFSEYKHFEEIQGVYLDKSDEIKDGHWGCHLHREFAGLNLDALVSRKQAQEELQNKMIEDLKLEKKKRVAYYLYKLVYFDALLDGLYECDKSAYYRLFGRSGNTLINPGNVGTGPVRRRGGSEGKSQQQKDRYLLKIDDAKSLVNIYVPKKISSNKGILFVSENDDNFVEISLEQPTLSDFIKRIMDHEDFITSMKQIEDVAKLINTAVPTRFDEEIKQKANEKLMDEKNPLIRLYSYFAELNLPTDGKILDGIDVAILGNSL